MGDYATPEEDIASDFQDDQTERNFAFFNELHSFGISKLIDLPQLIVIGDQSSGKSSVLQALTRLDFPTDQRMCTRFATEVCLQRSTSHTSTYMTVEIKIAQEHIQDFTAEHQQRIYDWNSHNSGRLDELDSQHFGRILRSADATIMGDERDANLLMNATLRIHQTGPAEPNLTIVDIPGLVSVSHEAHETAVSFMESYIENSRSIILAVLTAASDPETQDVYQRLKHIPDRENRVIGVINKCDMVVDGADHWVFEHIKNERRSRNSYYLTQGWFGLRNRRHYERNITNDERDELEDQWFMQPEWASLDQGLPSEQKRLGIKAVRNAVRIMLNKHIAKSIPSLVPEIREKITECKSLLDQLGQARSTKSDQLNCMITLATEFSRLSADALDGHYETLPDDQNAKIRKIYQDALDELQEQMRQDYDELFGSDTSRTALQSLDESHWKFEILKNDLFQDVYDVIRLNRGKEFSDKVNNPCVLNILWNEKTSSWQTRATEMIDEFLASIREAMTIFFDEACSDSDLRQKTKRWLAPHLEQAAQRAWEELDRIISDEANTIWTVNPRRSQRVKEIHDKRIKNMALDLADPSASQGRDGARAIENRIKSWLRNNGDIAAVFDTLDDLIGYYEIAMDRFTDNVGLQVVERHLLGPEGPLRTFTPQYVVRELGENEELLKIVAGEDASKQQQRESLNNDKENLEKMLQTAENYGFLSH